MRLILSVVTMMSLGACGGLYNSPSVSEGTTDVGDVKLVQITAETLSTANASDYRPRALPAVFGRSAGLAGGAMNAGALPEPAFLPEVRPGSLEMRLPPNHVPPSYQIGVSDVILLATPSSGSTVEALTGLLAAQSQRQGYVVQDDGSITVPQVGRIRLAGLTLEEAEAEVFQALVGRQIDPTFSIEIAEFNSQRVSLGGAVRTPKSLPITLKPISLSEALSAAGGIALKDQTYASIRLFRDGTLYQIPVKEYLAKSDLQRLYLKDGDYVYVDTAFDLEKAEGYFSQQIQLANFRQGARQAALTQLSTEIDLRRSELEEQRAAYLAQVQLDAVERDYVYVAGEVGVQNRFTLPFGRKATLADALFEKTAGVPNETGNISELYVIRADAKGPNVTAWRLNALNAANLILATRFELRPNDVIFVAEQPVTTLDRLVSQIAPTIGLATSF